MRLPNSANTRVCLFASMVPEKDCQKFSFLMGIHLFFLWLWTIHPLPPPPLPPRFQHGVAKRHVLLFCTLAERNRSKTPTVLNYFINEFKETLSRAVLCRGRLKVNLYTESIWWIKQTSSGKEKCSHYWELCNVYLFFCFFFFRTRLWSYAN